MSYSFEASEERLASDVVGGSPLTACAPGRHENRALLSSSVQTGSVQTGSTIGQKVLAYIALTKPKIMVMLLFTALCPMLVAAGRLPDAKLLVTTLFGLALSSGGGAVINMWFDRDIDALMSRTSDRPLVVGQIRPTGALVFGIVLILLSIVMLAKWVNVTTAVLSGLGAFYYSVIYTMWLKRRTPQNIVIGGGAGAFPPLVGWAAVTGHVSFAAICMFLIIFLWTPPHFWSLALFKNDDYRRARIPMMPVVRGALSTKRQSIAYALLLLISSLVLPLFTHVGWLYESVAALCGAVLLFSTLKMYKEPDGEFRWARRTFLYSLGYVPLVFVSMVFS